MMIGHFSSCRRAVVLAALLAVSAIPSTILAGKPAGKGGGAPAVSPVLPMVLEHEDYFFRVAGETSCIGEDDELDWVATGSLESGESFTFTPQVGACAMHPAAISVIASWEAGVLELSSSAPDADYSSWDPDQFGRAIVAPVYENQSQLCMFPQFGVEGTTYTITVTNRTNETVNGIRLHGRHENDWTLFYFERCMFADADGDGWNDSLEHTMANLLYPNGYIDGVFQPDLLWGSNYLRGRPETPAGHDEIDSYPPDFNDDGRVDDSDLDRLSAEVGQGNGIPLRRISPNPGPESYRENTLPWRRYDLDGDGFVAEEDLRILAETAGYDVPDPVDRIFPTARVLRPETGQTVTRGEYVQIESHAWDNRALARVDYVVNGKTVCSNTKALAESGLSSPLFFCWWQVPRKSTTHRIEVIVTDSRGQSTTSEPVFVDGL